MEALFMILFYIVSTVISIPFYLLVVLLMRVFDIFNAFTFTDPQDFMPLISLVIGLMSAGIIYNSPKKKASFCLIILMCLLAFWPILPNIGIYFMAHQFQLHTGSWPQVMVDDPKHQYGNISALFDSLSHLVVYLNAFSGAWMVTFIALYFAAKSRFTPMQRRIIIGLMVLMIAISILDPGGLYAWWMD
jgi:hypothetical protein